jgi:hypothetical protein
VLLREVGFPVGVFAASRLAVLVAWSASAYLADTRVLQGHWDERWYVNVAELGYLPVDPAGAVDRFAGGRNVASHPGFFPLLPMAMRWVAAVTGMSPLAAGRLLSLVFGALACVLLWRLVRRLADDGVADRAVALFAFFPGAVVFSFAYTETMLLALAIPCLGALLDRRWLLAGMLAAVATTTRPNAVVLIGCCAWTAGWAVLRRREWRALVAPALAPLGILGYFTFLWRRTGEPLTWFIVQREGWNERLDFGAGSVDAVLRAIGVGAQPAGPGEWQLVAGALTVLGGGWLLWRWRPPAELVIYTVGIIGLAVLSENLGPRPRFIVTAFPLIVALAHGLAGRRFTVLIATSAGLVIPLVFLYTGLVGRPIP